jgi:large subunit ribosomal protein L29
MAKKTVVENSDAELLEALADAKKELFNLRFQLATGQLENTARIPEVKRQAARINTEIRARELGAKNG